MRATFIGPRCFVADIKGDPSLEERLGFPMRDPFIRRGLLEQKAQSTFDLMLFLVPLLASLFVFVISKSPASHPTLRLFQLGD